MGGLTFALIWIAAVVVLVVGAVWERRKSERLDSDLTAYVAEGSKTPDTAKAILNTKATIARKREIAARIAGGMGLALLESMAAT